MRLILTVSSILLVLLPSQNTLTALLQMDKTLPMNDLHMTLIKSDGEVPVMLELWGMWSTPSLPSLPGPLWPRVLSMGQIKLKRVLMLN